jgi:2-phosphoglycerate kinase
MQNRNWDILIIGGASGSGKTNVSHPLSHFYGVDLVRVDDFQCFIEAVITPEMIPTLHYWKIELNWRNESVEWVVDRLKSVSQAWLPGLRAVIKDRLEENIPMVIEGDFVLPELAATFNNPRIRTIFVHEPLREQILQNYLSREGTPQAHRADISHAWGNWLKENCDLHNVPVIESRPWDNLMERMIMLLK